MNYLFSFIVLILLIVLLVVIINTDNSVSYLLLPTNMKNHSEEYEITISSDTAIENKIAEYCNQNNYTYTYYYPAMITENQSYVAFFNEPLNNRKLRLEQLIYASDGCDIIVLLDLESLIEEKKDSSIEEKKVIIYNSNKITFDDIQRKICEDIADLCKRELINPESDNILMKIFSINRYKVPFEHGYPIIINSTCFYSYKILSVADEYPLSKTHYLIPAIKYPKILSSNKKIPRVIHQTFEHLIVPEEFVYCIKQTQKMNPEYEYRYWTGNQCRNFIRDNFDIKVLKAYDTLYPGAFKADLWRVCALYIYGGVYMDIKFFPLVKFDDLISDDDDMLLTLDYYVPAIKKRFIYNAFFATVPKHPLLLSIIEQIVDNVSARRYENDPFNVLSLTGPGVWRKVLGTLVDRYLSTGKYQIEKFGKIHVLEHKYNYTSPCTVSDENGKDCILIEPFDIYGKKFSDARSIYWKCTGKKHYTREKRYIDETVNIY